MSDEEFGKIKAEYAAAKAEHETLSQGVAEPGSQKWEQVAARYNRARDAYSFAMQERTQEGSSAPAGLARVRTLRSYLAALEDQDTLLLEAVKANPTFEVPRTQANTIARMFEEIRADFPELIIEFQTDSDPTSVRAQIRSARMQVLRRIDALDGEGGKKISDSRPENAPSQRPDGEEPVQLLSPSMQTDRIVSTIRDGNESQRADILDRIRLSTELNRPALSERLRTEIRDGFGPNAETNFAAAIRDPKKISSIRSWLLSCLIWTDAEDPANVEVILEHLNPSAEPDRNVRFWTLAQLYVRRASYAQDAAEKRVSVDDLGEVVALSLAIRSPSDRDLIARFRSDLLAQDYETTWKVLRVLRIVPIPELAPDVCAQLERSAEGTPLKYDALYALSNPSMARAAAPILAQKPGLDTTVRWILAEARTSDPNAARNFTSLLRAFPAAEVDSALETAIEDVSQSGIAELIRGFLREHKQAGTDDEVVVAGYASDAIDISQDHVGIAEDVNTLAAVILAKEVRPPLAIGLFGDWGSGKSFFMQSMRRATEKLAERAAASNESKFCASIVSIEFNAWHYADTNLWASIVSYILEQLAARVMPEPTSEEQQVSLLAQLGSAKAMVEEAEGEKRRAQVLISSRAADLQRARGEREQKEIKLRDLRASDFHLLIQGKPELKKKLDETLDKLGVHQVLNSASDLARVASEVNSLRGRTVALVVSVLESKNRKTIIVLLVVLLLVIPGAAWLFSKYLLPSDFLVRVGAVASEAVAVIVAAKNVLARALAQMKVSIANIEQAKHDVDGLLAAKRQALNPMEEDLQKEIAALKAEEKESEARISAATARVVELEERISFAKEGRTLAHFLAERTRSEDYKKYLGLISTIRRDFDTLSTRLTGVTEAGDKLRRVDRIILYIDDLDRCPQEKVMEVLQAVHLLLAYPLFVVVVGVDPRWLQHSLRGTFKAFHTNRARQTHPDSWEATPQNYLEKIFQIPFSIRPMSPEGYSNLIGALLSPKSTKKSQSAPSHAVATSTPADEANSPTTTHQPTPDFEETKQQFVINEESLAIKPWEAEFAQRLFALIPTPRAAKRFSNVYRILKAPVQRDHLRAFEGTAELPGEFQLPMVLLAILIGTPAEAAELFPELWRTSLSKRSPEDVLLQGLAAPGGTGGLRVLREKLRPIVTDASFPRAPELYAKWIPRVSRFSFDVGRAVESTQEAPSAALTSSDV